MTTAPVRLPVLLLGLMLGAAACRTEPPSRAHVRRPAPAWVLKDLSGGTTSSAEFRGKVMVLNFWADWCAPCRAEIPGFVALQEKFAERGLVVVGVSVGGTTTTALARFVREARINYPVLIADDKMQAAFGGARPIPMTFIIDREGGIVVRHTGFMPAERLEMEIVPLIGR